MSSRDTSQYLAEELQKAGAPPDMIQRARAGYYHDFKSPLAMPITQLVHDAMTHDLLDIVKRAHRGEFDATKEEADEWAKSEDGQATFRDLLGGR
jgi:hypothetical protein